MPFSVEILHCIDGTSLKRHIFFKRLRIALAFGLRKQFLLFCFLGQVYDEFTCLPHEPLFPQSSRLSDVKPPIFNVSTKQKYCFLFYYVRNKLVIRIFCKHFAFFQKIFKLYKNIYKNFNFMASKWRYPLRTSAITLSLTSIGSIFSL